MTRLVAFTFAIVFALSATALNAMPLVPDQGPAGLVTQASGGCGVNFHRGP